MSESSLGVPLCDECGCAGNQECGLEYLDKEKGCALDDNLVCACCNKIGVTANKQRQTFRDENQLELGI